MGLRSIAFTDNSKVAYFLLGHTVQCRSNDIPPGPWHWRDTIPHMSSFFFAFRSLSLHPVNSCSRQEIGNTIT